MITRNISYLLIALLASCGLILPAQQTHMVQVLADAPENVHTEFLAIDVLACDLDWDLRSAGIYVGVNGRKNLAPGLVAEGKIQPTVLNMAGKGFSFLTEGGAVLDLGQKRKTDDVPVVLKYEAYAGEDEDGNYYDKTTYVKVQGTYLKTKGLRGGVYFKKAGYEPEEAGSVGESSMILGGLYTGLNFNSQALVSTRIDDRMDRIGAGFTRIYVDFLFLPLHTIVDPTLRATAEKNRIWGARAGMQWYLDPHDGKFKRMGRSLFSAETGVRPFTGFFINISWNYAILHF